MISLIVAATKNDVIGKAGGMPWRLRGDMKHFVETTMGKPVIMGRKTYESIGKPLKGRRTIILSRDKSLSVEGCEVVHTSDEALALLHNEPEIMVAGGAEIYRQFFNQADRIYLTRIDCELEGDAYFPRLELDGWAESFCSHQDADSNNDFNFDIVTLDKVKVVV